MTDQLQFKISSALKNIIGRDLINDDFIAVFELVKNSYDAHATRVDIYFEDIYSENAKIIIQDNGKGMSYEDLINKWLFVAYSAKIEGTEEDSYDYRDKIKIKRAYAGAKGIGRFSCDRLGSILYLETKKEESNSKTETLITDWEKFDGDLKDEFVNISVLHETLSGDAVDYHHGTKLEISRLHSYWDRPKFLKLKDALAKLINPNKTTDDSFQIYLHVSEEANNDSSQTEYRKIVNGKIQNLIFDTLNLKTTKITSFVSKDAIITQLYEGGRLIYKLVENNRLEYLHDIDYTIYFLNRSAKYSFTKQMGIHAVEYGHIFMYKNGLRIYPYGERGEDPLKMDNRKAQGNRRYLGTREVVGYIEIKGENKLLIETSSRGDGLQKNKTYHELVDWFYTTLRRIERYGIEIIDWGNDLSPDAYINFSHEDRLLALKTLVSRLTQSNNIIHYELDPEIFDLLSERQKNSAPAILQEIKEDISTDNFNAADVVRKIGIAEQKIHELRQIKDEAEQDAFTNLIKNEELQDELKTEKDQNKYLLATRPVSDDAFDVIHSIKISSQDIDASLVSIFNILDRDQIHNADLIREIEFVKYNNDKSKLLSEFITKANLKDLKGKTWIDIPQYITEYVENYNKGFHNKFSISCLGSATSFRSQISILDISIILDNLISNSRKAEATRMSLSFEKTANNKLQIDISDNGNGLSDEYIRNPESIFKLGITNKKGGSGIGLYTLREIIRDSLKGDINYAGKGMPPKGATFRIIIK